LLQARQRVFPIWEKAAPGSFFQRFPNERFQMNPSLLQIDADYRRMTQGNGSVFLKSFFRTLIVFSIHFIKQKRKQKMRCVFRHYKKMPKLLLFLFSASAV